MGVAPVSVNFSALAWVTGQKASSGILFDTHRWVTGVVKHNHGLWLMGVTSEPMVVLGAETDIVPSQRCLFAMYLDFVCRRTMEFMSTSE